MSGSVEELLYWNALCKCTHARDQHEDDECYGARLDEPPCDCEEFAQ